MPAFAIVAVERLRGRFVEQKVSAVVAGSIRRHDVQHDAGAVGVPHAQLFPAVACLLTREYGMPNNSVNRHYLNH